MKPILDVNDYTVGWIAPLEIEARAALGLLDNKHDGQFKTVPGDDHLYYAGDLYSHNIIIATLGGKPYGPGTAGALASHMKARFPNLWFGLLVGVAAGVPNLFPKDPKNFRDIRLGDVLVCEPSGTGSGIVYYDNIKATDDGPVLNGRLAETASIVTSAIQMLRTKDEDTFADESDLSKYLGELQRNDKKRRFLRPKSETDKLYNTENVDKLEERAPRNPSEYTLVWYGKIGSGGTLGRSARRRDELRDAYDIIGLETEAAGIMNTIAVGVVRGVCDYADMTKNKEWQPYAAATAAAYAKAVICQINPGISETQKTLEKDEKRRTENNAILIAMEEFANYSYSAFAHYPAAAFGCIDSSELTPSKMRESLEWFLGSSEYKSWSSGLTSQFLWHSGLPGSGKTTTSLFVVDNFTVTFLRCAVCVLCGIDVWPQPLTSAMLIYSMLSQLLGTRPNLLEKINLEDRLHLLHERHLSREGILWEALRLSIDNMNEHEIYIVIDGIDEINIEQRKHFLENLRDLWKVSTKMLRILVSSRSYHDIEDVLNNLPFINPDKESQGNYWRLDIPNVKIALLTTWKDCLNSLSIKAVNTRRTNIVDGLGDTGKWIFHNPWYHDWRLQPTSSLLWIQGKPGSGKSTLLKKILRTLLSQHDLTELYGTLERPGSSLTPNSHQIRQLKQRNAQSKIRNVVIASFFYSLRQIETSHAQMLQTLLYQLLWQERRLYPAFRETYRRLRESGRSTIWKFDDLKICFLSLATFSEFPLSVYFVIDAMDESDKARRPEILSLLLEMRSLSSSCTVKSVVASRPVEELIGTSPSCFHLILEKENTADIAQFTAKKMTILESTLEEKTALNNVERTEIVESAAVYLTSNAKGVFLWVELVTQDLLKCVSRGFRRIDFVNALDALPKDLVESYKRIVHELVFERTKHEREQYVEETKRMFTWVTFAASPLRIEVFGEAIAIPDLPNPVSKINITDYRYSGCDAIKLRVTSNCGDLLEIKQANASHQGEEGDTVQLLHQTVRDFLLTDDATPFNMIRSHGHNIIAKTCTQYLEMVLNRNEWKSTYEWIDHDYRSFVFHLSSWPLLSYIIHFLQYHLEHLEAPGQADFAEWILLDPTKPAWCLLSFWLASQKAGESQHPDPEHTRNFRDKCLDIAAETGMPHVVDIMLAVGAKLPYRNFSLQIAAKKGHLDVVRLLLRSQIAEDQRENRYGSPLQMAAYNGHLSIVQLLLDNGADPNAEGDPYSTALEAAAFNGHLDIIAVLLDKGGDINARYRTTALQAAALRGNEQVVRFLLQKGADIQTRDGDYGTTALQAALFCGHKAVADLLIEQGAR